MKRSYRFNYVMTDNEGQELQFLFEHYRKTRVRCSTKGSILRKLVSEEVKRLKKWGENTPL